MSSPQWHQFSGQDCAAILSTQRWLFFFCNAHFIANSGSMWSGGQLPGLSLWYPIPSRGDFFWQTDWQGLKVAWQHLRFYCVSASTCRLTSDEGKCGRHYPLEWECPYTRCSFVSFVVLFHSCFHVFHFYILWLEFREEPHLWCPGIL